jgi:hypothetical protein
MTTHALANNEIKSATGNRFYLALEQMKEGRTTVINGAVVTKWGYDTFEIGTWGKKTVTSHEAVDALMK